MSLWSDLEHIRYATKRKFIYMSDMDRYGKREYWTRSNEAVGNDGKLYGDCEDFAMACQQACETHGIKNSRLVTCKTENGGHHCVLEVEGYILDNRQGEVKDRSDLGYKWLKIQDHDGTWRDIIDA